MIDVVFRAMEGIFTIVFVVGIGCFLGWSGWFEEKNNALIARLVTHISLPCYLVAGMTKRFTFENLIELVPDMQLPVASMAAAMVIGFLFVKLFRIREGRRGIFHTNFFIANTMFIGLPVNLALFGDESIPSVMLYYVVNTIFFWAFGVYNIVSDTAPSVEAFSFRSVKKLFSPPLLGFIAAVFLIVLNIRIPDALRQGMQYVGNLTTPLSLIFIGAEISKIPFKEFHFEKDILLGIFGRFVVCPVCVLAMVPFFSVAPISAKVFTMQAAMPAMTQMAIVAKQYGSDSQYAAALSFITILFGLIVIPMYMVIMNIFI